MNLERSNLFSHPFFYLFLLFRILPRASWKIGYVPKQRCFFAFRWGHCGRILTTILYLNPNWQENDGGAIRLFEVPTIHWVRFLGIWWPTFPPCVCFWWEIGSLNCCRLENEMPWFCRCSMMFQWQMLLPTNHQQTSLSFTSKIIWFLLSLTQPLQIIPVHHPPPNQKTTHIILCKISRKTTGGTTFADPWGAFTLTESTLGFLGGWGTTWSLTTPTRRQKRRVRVSLFGLHVWFVHVLTVDGWNPAPPRMMIIPLFIGVHPSQVMQDFSHQQNHSIMDVGFFHCAGDVCTFATVRAVNMAFFEQMFPPKQWQGLNL